MRMRLDPITCMLLLTLVGCKSAPIPFDPLFAGRKPVETKAQSGPPRDMPMFEPTPPVQRFYLRR